MCVLYLYAALGALPPHANMAALIIIETPGERVLRRDPY